jgi:hypothetical protein
MFDLGDNPIGSPPTEAQKAQVLSALGAVQPIVKVLDNREKLALANLAVGQLVEIVEE